MDLPVYKEYTLSKRSIAHWDEYLENLPIGQRPFYLNLKNLDDDQQIDIIEWLEQKMIQSNLCANIPYPFFVISSVEDESSSLNILTSVDNLPHFYNRQDKKPHAKELEALKKLQLKSSRLKAAALKDIKLQTQQYAQSHAELAKLCFEGEYLERLKALMLNKNKGF